MSNEKKVEKEITEAEAIWNLVQFLKENQEKQRKKKKKPEMKAAEKESCRRKKL